MNNEVHRGSYSSPRTYNIERVEDKIGLDKDHYIIDKVDVYVDRMSKDKGFAVCTIKREEYGKEVEHQEIIVFDNSNDRDEFLKKCFAREKRIHDVDYATIYFYRHDKSTEKNYMEIRFIEYFGREHLSRSIRVPLKYQQLMERTIKEYRKNDTRLNREFDGYYREINVDEKKPKLVEEKEEEEAPKRITRMERRRQREKTAFPMPDPNERKVKIRLIAGVTALSIVVGGVGYVVVRNAFADKAIVFEQKNTSNFDRNDRFIKGNVDRASTIIDKYMDNKAGELSKDDLPFLYDFVTREDASNYDQNASSTKILYDDYFSDKYLLNKDDPNYNIDHMDVDELLEKIERYYDSSFGYNDQNNLVLKDEASMRYLKFVGSLSVMPNRYPGAWNNSIPDNDDSINGYASTKEVSVFGRLNPMVQYLILSQYRGVLEHSNFTPERAAYYFDTIIDKATLIRKVDERIGELKDFISSKYNYLAQEGKKNTV